MGKQLPGGNSLKSMPNPPQSDIFNNSIRTLERTVGQKTTGLPSSATQKHVSVLQGVPEASVQSEGKEKQGDSKERPRALRI